MQRKMMAVGVVLAVLFFGHSPALAAKGHQEHASTTVEDLFLSDARMADSVRRVLDWSWEISGRDIRHLREENLGYGEISLLYGLAKESGHSANELLHMRKDEKMGWGQIAHHFGVKVSDAHRRADSILDGCGMEQEKSRLRVRLEEDDREHRHHGGGDRAECDNGHDRQHDGRAQNGRETRNGERSAKSERKPEAAEQGNNGKGKNNYR